MAHGFAGSQRLDERRRRRLSQDGEQSCDESLVDGVPRRRRRLDPSEARPARRQVLLPIPALVPAQTWKLIGLAFLALLPAGAGMAVTHRIGEWSQKVGPGLERLVNGSPMPLLHWYECLLLLGMALLAGVIGWVRSRSHHDYSGRYWVWARFALVCVLAASSRATGLHLALSETIAHFTPVRFWQSQTLFWLVPGTVVIGSLLWTLRHEMRQGQGSWPGLVVGCMAYWVAALGCLEVLDTVLPHATERVIDVARFAGHGLCLLGLLLHARHVVHRSAEPAPLPARRAFPRPHFGFLFRKKKATPLETAPEAPKARRTTKPKRTRRAKAKASPSAAEPDDEPESDETPETNWNEEALDEEPVEETPAAPAPRVPDRWQPATPVAQSTPASRPQPAPPAAADDEGEGEDEDGEDDGLENHPSLQGLSRKQRRKMLKHLRQQQRR